MYGAIIGDLAGSIYEYDQFVNGVHSIEVGEKLIPDNAFYSDDTLLTLAVLKARLQAKRAKKTSAFIYEDALRAVVREHKGYLPSFSPYFDTPFSPAFTKWAKRRIAGSSDGNGAIMRISPVAWLCDTPDACYIESINATLSSHGSADAIKAANVIALTIFNARKGIASVRDTVARFQDDRHYEGLLSDVKEPHFTKFNYTCRETIGACLYVAMNATSFEDAVRTMISYGGDTDTNAAIVGSIVEAVFGIPEELKEQAERKLPEKFNKLLRKGYAEVDKVSWF